MKWNTFNLDGTALNANYMYIKLKNLALSYTLDEGKMYLIKNCRMKKEKRKTTTTTENQKKNMQ